MFQPTSYDQQLIELLEKRLDIYLEAMNQAEAKAKELGVEIEDIKMETLASEELKVKISELDYQITKMTAQRNEQKEMIQKIQEIGAIMEVIKENKDIDGAIRELFNFD